MPYAIDESKALVLVVVHAGTMSESSVVHMVLVRWKSEREREPASASASASADLERLAELVVALPDRIPGVLSAHCGPSTSPEGLERGFEWALVVAFDSSAARDGYLPHPEHEPVKELISRWADEVLVFDLVT